MQTAFHHGDVGHLAAREFDGIDEAALGIDIDANVGFHPGVPLIALLGLRHFGIAFLLLVLGGTRRGNPRGIDDRAPLHGQPLLGKQPGHFGKDGGCQIVLFQQMTKTHDGAFVRHDVFEGIQSGKAAQQGNVVQGFFNRRVGVTEPLLHEVFAQHRAQRHRRATAPLLRVVRLDQCLQARPRHNRFHLRQEYRLAGLLPRLRQEARLGQAQLLHRLHQFNGRYDNGSIFSN